MKCLRCGNDELHQITLEFECFEDLVFGPQRTADAFACYKCGHIELKLSKEELERYHEKVKQEAKEKAKKKRYEKLVKKLEKEAEELKKIINNENNTVKSVKEAQEKLIKINLELSEANKELGN